MKKLLYFLILCCLILIGCTNKENNKNKDLLIGEWEYLKTELNETQYSYFEFNEDNSFKYSTCFSYGTDDYCATGQAKWSGTYKLNNNRIELKVESEKQLVKRYGSDLASPPVNLIVDFEKMYICDANEGLDCSKPYSKDTN